MDRAEERALAARIMNQDEAAFFELHKTYKTYLFNFIYRKLKDKELSEEIVQDVFLDFIEALRNFQHQSSLKTFLFSIAKNKVIDAIRRKQVKRVIFSHLPYELADAISSVMIEDELEKKELAEKIHSVFNQLPHDYKLILRLKYVEGERVKRIADKLSLTFKATESLLFRARRAFIDVFNSNR